MLYFVQHEPPWNCLSSFSILIKTMRKLLLMTLLAAAALPAAAQRHVSGATVKRVLNTLAADDMQGRATGQPGQLKAAEFLVLRATYKNFRRTKRP
jgi:hypothetical protein